jgi:hypothetical protein
MRRYRRRRGLVFIQKRSRDGDAQGAAQTSLSLASLFILLVDAASGILRRKLNYEGWSLAASAFL